MWAEARRQEKKIRGIMVDYKKRAERRREYYEKIRQDPTQFLRLHGRSCKIHLEQSVAEAAESPATMMPWQGDNTNMIDRFDVRAHLDMIPPINPIKPKLTSEEEKDERRCNYERYRILVQNEYARISEEQCLKQIEIDETFPLHSKSRENQKLESKKAAIGFTYEDSTPQETDNKKENWEDEESEESDSSLSDIDLDVEIEVAELTDDQKQQVNNLGEKFGMGKTNMVRNLERERVEAEDFKRAKEEEAEKALYSGRKSRRERRALIEKRLRERRGEQMSPPSYAQRGSPDYSTYKGRSSSSSSRSRSKSPVDSGQVTFITSFGGEEEKKAKVPSSTKKDGAKASKKKTSASAAALSSSSKTRGRSSSVSSNSSSSSGSSTPPRPVKPPRSPNTSRSSSSSSSRSRERAKRKEKAKSRSKTKSRSKSPVRSRGRPRRSPSPSRGHGKSGSRHSRNSRSRSRDRRRRTRSKTPPRERRERARSRTRSRERKTIPKQADIANSKLKKKETPTAALKANTQKALTPQEKMKLKMQKALNKQHKADKIKEIKKKEEKYQAEQDREEELQERMWKMRKLERDKVAREREEQERRRRKYSSSSQSSRENTPERKYRKQSDRQYSSRYSRSPSRSLSRSPSPPHRSHKR